VQYVISPHSVPAAPFVFFMRPHSQDRKRV